MPDKRAATGRTAATSPTARRRSSASISCAIASKSPAKRGRTTHSGVRRAGGPGGLPTARQSCPRAEHYFALVDEADNIFIDDAKTRSSSPRNGIASTDEQIVFKWANEVAQQMEPDKHFEWDAKKQKLELTSEGKRLANWANPPSGKHSHAMDKLYEHLEQSLHAHHRFRLDQHYMVDPKSKKVVIIDEGTGRSMPDRHWREGLHQAVEAKEGVTINQAVDHAAQITFQSFFKLYKKPAGKDRHRGTELAPSCARVQVAGRVRADEPSGDPQRSAGSCVRQ